MRTSILALCVILAGCTASQPPIAIKMDNPIPPMPVTLKQPCALIPELPDTLTMGTLVEQYDMLVNQYTICRLSNQAKILWAIQNGL